MISPAFRPEPIISPGKKQEHLPVLSRHVHKSCCAGTVRFTCINFTTTTFGVCDDHDDDTAHRQNRA